MSTCSMMRRRSDNSPLCKRCRKINLDAVFRGRHHAKSGGAIHAWQGPIDRDNIDNCPLCQLIMKTFLLSKEEMCKNDKELRSFPSGRIPNQGWASVDTTILSLDQRKHYGIPYLVSQPKGTEIVRLFGSHAGFSLMKDWLRYCEARHTKTCASARDKLAVDSIPSLKFIDCDTRTIVPANGMPYVALSYLRGAGPQGTIPFTTKLPGDIPRTIRVP